jgi:hypothetical protein
MIIHFVSCNVKEEIEVIKNLKPPALLLSYHYFKNIELSEWVSKIGYQPNIMLDSGAYSAFTQGKPISLDSYINYINSNIKHINSYIALDYVLDGDKSLKSYLQMLDKGLSPLPCFHVKEPFTLLEEYLKYSDYISLGGSVPIRNKSAVANWINSIISKYPAKYHALGTSSKKVLNSCDELYSLDSSTWILQAIMGNPKHIDGGIVEKATYNMKELMQYSPKTLTTKQTYLF